MTSIIGVTEFWRDGNNVTVYYYPCASLEVAQELIRRLRKEVDNHSTFFDGVFKGQVSVEPKSMREGVIRTIDGDYGFDLIDTEKNMQYKAYISEDTLVTNDNISEIAH